MKKGGEAVLAVQQSRYSAAIICPALSISASRGINPSQSGQLAHVARVFIWKCWGKPFVTCVK